MEINISLQEPQHIIIKVENIEKFKLSEFIIKISTLFKEIQSMILSQSNKLLIQLELNIEIMSDCLLQ